MEGYKSKLDVQLLSVPLAISSDTHVEFFVFLKKIHNRN